MKSFIRKHNNRTLTKNTTQNRTTTNNESHTCNCQRPDECPIPGNCLAKSVVCQVEVTTNDNGETKNYLGITANHFKQRYHEKYANDTELSLKLKLKMGKPDYRIKWSIIKHIAAYKPGQKRCNLCLEEKLLLMKAKKKHFLNRRTEFFAKCRHVTKHQLN